MMALTWSVPPGQCHQVSATRSVPPGSAHQPLQSAPRVLQAALNICAEQHKASLQEKSKGYPYLEEILGHMYNAWSHRTGFQCGP